jgi:hypothetical protein
MDRFNFTENEALKIFYESHTGMCYSDDSTGLYGQSANYVFSLFCEEISGYSVANCEREVSNCVPES